MNYFLVRIKLSNPDASKYNELQALLFKEYHSQYIADNVFGRLFQGEYYAEASADKSEADIALELKNTISKIDGNPSIKVIEIEGAQWDEGWETLRAS